MSTKKILIDEMDDGMDEKLSELGFAAFCVMFQFPLSEDKKHSTLSAFSKSIEYGSVSWEKQSFVKAVCVLICHACYVITNDSILILFTFCLFP